MSSSLLLQTQCNNPFELHSQFVVRDDSLMEIFRYKNELPLLHFTSTPRMSKLRLQIHCFHKRVTFEKCAQPKTQSKKTK